MGLWAPSLAHACSVATLLAFSQGECTRRSPDPRASVLRVCTFGKAALALQRLAVFALGAPSTGLLAQRRDASIPRGFVGTKEVLGQGFVLGNEQPGSMVPLWKGPSKHCSKVSISVKHEMVLRPKVGKYVLWDLNGENHKVW